MRKEQTRTGPLGAACAILAVFSLSCGGSSPAGPSPQPPPPAAAAPTLTAISPAVGVTTGGQNITIAGTGFIAGATVSIGAAATNVAVASATSITATTPARAAGQADIAVTNPDGQSGRLGGFSYGVPSSPPPSIAAAGPASGPVSGGTSVSITGGGFAPGATVSFGAATATAVNVAGESSITATAPAGNPGSVDLVVTNPDGQNARLPNGFTYVSSAPPPPPPPSPVAPTSRRDCADAANPVPVTVIAVPPGRLFPLTAPRPRTSSSSSPRPLPRRLRRARPAPWTSS
jgi:IPT/TIG domain